MKTTKAVTILGIVVGLCLTVVAQTSRPPAVVLTWNGSGLFTVLRSDGCQTTAAAKKKGRILVGATTDRCFEDRKVKRGKTYTYWVTNPGGEAPARCVTLPKHAPVKVAPTPVPCGTNVKK